jgi:hypothetical protein
LIIDFQGTAANKESVEYKEGDKVVSEIYVRARVRNDGQQVARGCRVFLSSLAEVQASGTMPTVLHDAKPLAWAGYDFSALDVPPGVDFYVDVIRISKQYSGWLFPVPRLFASQQELKNYRGTYRFHLLLTAYNATPAACVIDVVYDGDWHSLRAFRARAA